METEGGIAAKSTDGSALMIETAQDAAGNTMWMRMSNGYTVDSSSRVGEALAVYNAKRNVGDRK